MNPIIPVNTFELLDEGLNTARGWESSLGKSSTGKAEKAFSALKAGRLEAGDPQLSILQLHRSDFEKAGISLSPEIQLDLKGPSCRSYYLVPVSVLLFPGRGAQYRLLEADLSVESSKNDQNVAIHTAFPEPLWKPVLNWGGAMHLGLDGRLTWGMEVDKIAADLGNLKGELAARVKNVNQLKSFITVMPFEYSLGRMEIASEFHNQRAMWRMDSKAVIREQKHTQFVLLLKAPPTVRQFKLSIALQAEPSYDWLIMQVEHVFEHLPEAIQGAVKRKKGLPMQFFASWDLNLLG